MTAIETSMWLIAGVTAVYLIHVVRADVVGQRSTWEMLKQRYQTDVASPDSTNGPHSVLGKMRVFDHEYVGCISLSGDGVIFRYDVWRGFDLVVFPWQEMKGFCSIQDDSRATFALDRSVGTQIPVEIPWSPDFEELRSAINERLSRLGDT